jgi:hypothetical protein
MILCHYKHKHAQIQSICLLSKCITKHNMHCIMTQDQAMSHCTVRSSSSFGLIMVSYCTGSFRKDSLHTFISIFIYKKTILWNCFHMHKKVHFKTCQSYLLPFPPFLLYTTFQKLVLFFDRYGVTQCDNGKLLYHIILNLIHTLFTVLEG